MTGEEDHIQDHLTQQLIGFLTGAGTLGDRDDHEEEFLHAVGTLAIDLMPAFTITGRMTQEELSDRISTEMTGRMIRLLSSFAFLFSELAKVNDGDTAMTSAEVLQTISLNIRNLDGEG